jgi:hypothetical protein
VLQHWQLLYWLMDVVGDLQQSIILMPLKHVDVCNLPYTIKGCSAPSWLASVSTHVTNRAFIQRSESSVSS